LSIFDAPLFVRLLADCIHRETRNVPRNLAARTIVEDGKKIFIAKQMVPAIPEPMMADPGKKKGKIRKNTQEYSGT
jgi:hypothetical protein